MPVEESILKKISDISLKPPAQSIFVKASLAPVQKSIAWTLIEEKALSIYVPRFESPINTDPILKAKAANNNPIIDPKEKESFSFSPSVLGILIDNCLFAWDDVKLLPKFVGSDGLIPSNFNNFINPLLIFLNSCASVLNDKPNLAIIFKDASISKPSFSALTFDSVLFFLSIFCENTEPKISFIMLLYSIKS